MQGQAVGDIYHIAVRSFNPSGLLRMYGRPVEGSLLRQIRDTLDIIANMGMFRWIWLTGIHPIGEAEKKNDGSCYAIRDHQAVDPAVGSEDNLSALAEKARELGMGLMGDLVLNHVAADSPLIERCPEFFIQCGCHSGCRRCYNHRKSGRRIRRAGIFQTGKADVPYDDVVQLDLSHPGTVEMHLDTVHHLGRWFDGWRLDAAGDILTKSFAESWGRNTEILPRIRQKTASKTLLAEAHRGFDELATAGMDKLYYPQWYNALSQPKKLAPLQEEAHRVQKAFWGDDRKTRLVSFVNTHDFPIIENSPHPWRVSATIMTILAPRPLLWLGSTEMGNNDWLQKPDPITWHTQVNWPESRQDPVYRFYREMFHRRRSFYGSAGLENAKVNGLGNGDSIVGFQAAVDNRFMAVVANPNTDVREATVDSRKIRLNPGCWRIVQI